MLKSHRGPFYGTGIIKITGMLSNIENRPYWVSRSVNTFINNYLVVSIVNVNETWL